MLNWVPEVFRLMTQSMRVTVIAVLMFVLVCATIFLVTVGSIAVLKAQPVDFWGFKVLEHKTPELQQCEVNMDRLSNLAMADKSQLEQLDKQQARLEQSARERSDRAYGLRGGDGLPDTEAERKRSREFSERDLTALADSRKVQEQIITNGQKRTDDLTMTCKGTKSQH